MVSSKNSGNPIKMRLDQCLVLTHYILSLFNCTEFIQLQAVLRDVEFGIDDENHSSYVSFCQQKISSNSPFINKITEYDENIIRYLHQLNSKRLTPLKLQYFQYLTILFTEIYLDAYFQDPNQLIESLNHYVTTYFTSQSQSSKISGDNFRYTKQDLNKLAFWMATGSGKTIILHINLLQFLHYNRGKNHISYDNLLLITPNETLSMQHLSELNLSGISGKLFLDSSSITGLSSFQNEAPIQVLDIYKFTEDKKGNGITVDIESFGMHNIIFVDEGHKGSGGLKWRRFREFVATYGFTFEYSATFGQAIAALNKESELLLGEYGKSIIFDYSYRYFYADGYGKDYYILNLSTQLFSHELEDRLLMANLLSFYEQKIFYAHHPALMKEYSIESPLWIFVGSKVAGQQQQSDILRIVEFVDHFLQNSNQWAESLIERILQGKSGLLDLENQDIFDETQSDRKLSYLHGLRLTPTQLYHDILIQLFHSLTSTSLSLIAIKKAPGEIGLRAGVTEYFGVINIGDESQFLKLVKSSTKISVQADEFNGSLFDSINQAESAITLLIGAKKFIEGWNSWRVSTMGLLNVGKSEGSQVIQLFGRGVRLHGKGHSLKRSAAVEMNPPQYLKLVESLNIFSIKATYMEQFRHFLEMDGIIIDPVKKLDINFQIKPSSPPQDQIDYAQCQKQFANTVVVQVVFDPQIHVELDLSPQVEILSSNSKTQKKNKTAISNQSMISSDYFPLFNWDRIYFAMLDFREQKSWYNLVFTKAILQQIMITNSFYTLFCPHEYLSPTSMADLQILQDIVIKILKKYLNTYYHNQKQNWIEKTNNNRLHKSNF